MKKISIIQGKNSEWISCRTIIENLVCSYKLLCNKYDINIINPETYIDDDFYEVYSELKSEDPDIISVMTHCPVPFKLFLYLNQDPQFKSKKFIIHVFGDFMEFYNVWADSLALLEGMDVSILCASEAQQKVVQNLVNNKNGVKYVPFCVDDNKFFYDQDLREDQRQKMKLSKEEIAILYTGRISSQKSVLQLISCFNYLREKFKANCKLYVAGVCDDIAVRYLNKEMLNLFYPYQCFEKISNTDDIEFLGVLNKKQLNAYYNACDIFCSLSVHNDEDFGMSPSEALATGAQCLLTEWGGYKSFNFKNTEYIPVTIDTNSLKFDQKLVVKKLFVLANVDKLNKDRKLRSEDFYKRFGFEFVANQLSEVIKNEDKFKGLTKEAGEFVIKSLKRTLFHVNGNYSPEYLEIYKGKYD